RQSSTDVKFPRCSNRRTTMLNQSSMWFSQLGCFGVYINRMRWLTSLKNAARVCLDGTIPLFSFAPVPPPLQQEAVVGHLVGESVLEGIGKVGEEARLIEELGRLQAGEALTQVHLGHPGDGVKQRVRDVRAKQCRGLQEALLIRSEPVDPRSQDRLHRGRHLN